MNNNRNYFFHVGLFEWYPTCLWNVWRIVWCMLEQETQMNGLESSNDVSWIVGHFRWNIVAPPISILHMKSQIDYSYYVIHGTKLDYITNEWISSRSIKILLGYVRFCCHAIGIHHGIRFSVLTLTKLGTTEMAMYDLTFMPENLVFFSFNEKK